jgi:hypothetical protein
LGVPHDNSAYAQWLAEHTQRYAEEMGVDVAFHDVINPDDTDFAPIPINIGAAGLNAVYFTSYQPCPGQATTHISPVRGTPPSSSLFLHPLTFLSTYATITNTRPLSGLMDFLL